MPLTTKQKQQFKARAHKLKPIVMVSANNGLTMNVLTEIDRALSDHELIKVRLATEDRELRQTWLTEICQTSQAEVIQLIGKIGIIYRKRLEEMLSRS